MNKITPCLWFDKNIEEAINFYISVFKNSKVIDISRYKEVGPGEKGSIMTAIIKLGGREFMLLNGGPQYTFSPAVSFVVDCKTQEEVDYYWEKLTEGGKENQCGWLTDKFGVSWQIVPTILAGLLSDPDPDKVNRVMTEMLMMGELNIPRLIAAYESA